MMDRHTCRRKLAALYLRYQAAFEGEDRYFEGRRIVLLAVKLPE